MKNFNENPLLPGAELRLVQLFTADEAQLWFTRLYTEIAWEQHWLRIFNRELAAPRLSRWVGDPTAIYTYSRAQFVPHPWTPGLAEIRDQVSVVCAEKFNSVLCNLYRNGHDNMGWHSDDEPELGETPIIGSLSFGAVRRFRLRHKQDKNLHVAFDLAPGSLLVMAGATQRNYRHALPKTRRTIEPRINLTFRHVINFP